MATKTLPLGQVGNIAAIFMNEWDKCKDEVRLSGKSLYSLLGIRKVAMEQFRQIQETAITLARNAGGTEMENGNIKVPDDKVAGVNQELNDLQNGDFTLEYTPIVIGDNDYLPIAFMDALYDFIELK